MKLNAQPSPKNSSSPLTKHESHPSINGLIEGFEKGERQFWKLNLAYLDGSGLKLPHCDLKGADFSFAQLRCLDFSGCDLRGVNFRAANLSGSSLAFSDLRGANLTDCNLKDVDLTGANLNRAILERVKLHKTQLKDCILPDNRKWDFRPTVSGILSQEALAKLYDKRLKQRKNLGSLICLAGVIALLQFSKFLEFFIFHVLLNGF